MHIIKKNLIKLIRVNKEKIKTNRKNGIFIDRNENPINYNNNVRKKLLDKIKKVELGRYPDVDIFKNKLAKFLRLKKENIFITEGVSGAIKSLMEVYTIPKKTNIIFPNPTFAMYPVFTKMFDVKSIKIPYVNYDLDFKQMINSTNKKTSLVFLPNPNNPIEGALSIKKIKKILKKCEKNKCFLVLDEVYYPFGNITGINLIKKSNYVFVMRSFSKAGGLAGIRLGYLVGNKKNIEHVSKVRGGYETNILAMEVGSFFIDNYNIILNQIKIVKKGFKFLVSQLKKSKIEHNGAVHGNYIFINLKSKKKSLFVTDFLKQKRIFVRTGWPSPFNQGFSLTGADIKIMKKFFYVFQKALSAYNKKKN